MDEFENLRRQLLQRLVTGEIDREEYEWTLSEIERHQSGVDTAPVRGQTDTQVDAQPVGSIQPGMVLGSHTVMRILGKGGMGEVWLASEMVNVSIFYSVIKLLPAVRDEAKKMLAIFHKVNVVPQ